MSPSSAAERSEPGSDDDQRVEPGVAEAGAAGEASQGIDPEKLARLVDVGVYAPIGLAVEIQKLLPDLIAAGKRQIGFSRSLGRAALKTVLKAAAEAATASPDAAEAPEAAQDTQPGGSEIGVTVPKDYDTWTAKQAVGYVRCADASSLASILAHEAANKNRKTVLAAIGRAQADSP